MVHTSLMPIAISSDIIELSSENETKELAEKFLKKLKGGDIIYLYGEMGVGKTTFIRYLINAFQKKNNLQITEVTSPTFNILHQYDLNLLQINHYDLFRLKTKEEIKNLGIFEDDLNTITLIEWPQLIEKKPKKLIELIFNYENDHQMRSIKIKGLDFKLFR